MVDRKADIALSPIIPEMTLRAWLVGQILPVIVAGMGSEEEEVATALQYADEAIKQLGKQVK